MVKRYGFPAPPPELDPLFPSSNPQLSARQSRSGTTINTAENPSLSLSNVSSKCSPCSVKSQEPFASLIAFLTRKPQQVKNWNFWTKTPIKEQCVKCGCQSYFLRIHILKISFLTKFTISKSHFFTKFQNLIFRKIHNFKVLL